MNDTEFRQLVARLAALHKKCDPDRPWWVEREPHDYADGTTHFTHVCYTADAGGPAKVVIGSYLTPELAEMLVLMRNSLPEIIERLRKPANIPTLEEK